MTPRLLLPRQRQAGTICGDTLTLAAIDAVIAHDMAMIAQPNGAQGLDLAALAVWSERCSQLPAFDKTRWKG